MLLLVKGLSAQGGCSLGSSLTLRVSSDYQRKSITFFTYRKCLLPPLDKYHGCQSKRAVLLDNYGQNTRASFRLCPNGVAFGSCPTKGNSRQGFSQFRDLILAAGTYLSAASLAARYVANFSGTNTRPLLLQR